MTALVFAVLPLTAEAGLSQQPEAYRDLNHNGRMDAYEDARRPIAERVDDLLGQMTLEEKAGTLMHGSLPATDELGHGERYDLGKSRDFIETQHVTSFITRLSIPPRDLATQNNTLQKLAAEARLGIPLTISTDPRNHFQAVFGATTTGGGFSLWPEPLGLAAIGDAALVRSFADTARREYRAVGIHMALSPQADLATEPRWPRLMGTFGTNPEQVSSLVQAYVEGFQNGADGVRSDGVATVVKHWVAYGAQPHGFDGHNAYGAVSRVDNESFGQHVAAFSGAFSARVAGVMPAYPVLEGITLDDQPLEAVGAGFNRQLLGPLLRDKMGFGGFVLSDWAITNDCPAQCMAPTAEKPQGMAIAMPWGVEALSQQQRFAKAINAGVDQFGGVADPAPLIAAVHAGVVSQQRIDEATRRVLDLKFRLGLFDNPFVDVDAADAIVGNPAAQAAAKHAQRASQVILENRARLMPFTPKGKRVWLHKIAPAVARAQGFIVVDDPAKADLAILRVDAPFETLHPHHFFGSRQNEGRLDYRDGDEDYEAIKQASAAVPTMVAVNLDRPAILTNIRPLVPTLVATFGASDAAVLDVMTGRAVASGTLPFELPSSMAAVENQDPARPNDSEQPLYPVGWPSVTRRQP